MVLVLIFIVAIASYGLMVGIMCITQAQKSGIDIRSYHVVPFVSVSILAFLGSTIGSVASGIAIMQLGIMRPDLVMRSMIPVVMNGTTGIYGLIEASIEINAGDGKLWPPKGSDCIAGIFYLVSSLCLGYVGYHGVIKLEQDPRRQFVQMVTRLIGCQSIGLMGIIFLGFAKLRNERV